MADTIHLLNSGPSVIPVRYIDNGDGTFSLSVSGGGAGGSSGPDRELVVSTYRCKTAFTGASVNDTITATQIIDVSGASPTTVGTVWRNQTTAADLASAPSAANLELTGSTALTAAQLTAAGLALETTQLQVRDLLPATAGTREHVTATISRQAVGATSARVALPALGTSREVYVMAEQRCFFLTGSSTVEAAASTSHPLAADERFYFKVPEGHTHIACIRSSTDGNITICAVA